MKPGRSAACGANTTLTADKDSARKRTSYRLMFHGNQPLKQSASSTGMSMAFTVTVVVGIAHGFSLMWRARSMLSCSSRSTATRPVVALALNMTKWRPLRPLRATCRL